MLKNFLTEFRNFAVKGNVIDLAVAFIMGAAFGKVVTSVVEDIIMPPLVYAISGIDLSDWNWEFALDGEGKPVSINTGNFIMVLIHFIIVSFAVFMLVKMITRFKGKQPEPAPSEKRCSFCDTNIPIKAVRCPHCTSELGATPGPAAA